MLGRQLRQAVQLIAKSEDPPPLLSLNGALYPLLRLCTIIFESGSLLRQGLYTHGFLQQARLPLPVISVGNITWGGNGKTPMVQYLAEHFIAQRLAPLVVTRGYGGGDEVRLLQHNLRGTSAHVAVGVDRIQAAWTALRERGFSPPPKGLQDLPGGSSVSESLGKGRPEGNSSRLFRVVILDDALQNLRTARDLDVVMVNAVAPWGNGRLIPSGPLRERPHAALARAHVVALHQADLVADSRLEELEDEVARFCRTGAAVVRTRMAPRHFLRIAPLEKDKYVGACSLGMSAAHLEGGGLAGEGESDVLERGASDLIVDLSVVRGAVVLCVAGIGSPEPFRMALEKLGAWHVECCEFDDHHWFDEQDMLLVSGRLASLQKRFPNRVIFVVLTQKDYMRDPSILQRHLGTSPALVLISKLAMVEDRDESSLQEALRRRL